MKEDQLTQVLLIVFSGKYCQVNTTKNSHAEKLVWKGDILFKS